MVATEKPRSRWRLAAWIAIASAVLVSTAGCTGSRSGHSTSKLTATSTGTPLKVGTVPNLHCPVLPKAIGAAAWVPARPQGVDGTTRLVPLLTPARALVCAYIGPHSPAGKSGSVELTGNLAGIATDLAWVPPVSGSDIGCSANLLATDGDYYLVGLSYPTGQLWVSAPANHCEGSDNGSFASPAHLAGLAAGWYRAGHWVADNPASPCGPGTGRLGQQLQLIPPGATTITICDAYGKQLGWPHPVTDAAADRLIRALGAKPTGPAQPTCIPTGANFWEYQLFFHYREGPAVRVDVLANCRPAIDNGSLQAPDATDILPLVAALVSAR